MNIIRSVVLAGAGALAFVLPHTASASLLGQNITVTVDDYFGGGGSFDYTDTVLAGAGLEITGGDGSNIGGDGSAGGGGTDGVLFTGESVDIGETSFTLISSATFTINFVLTGWTQTLIGFTSPAEGNDIDNVFNENISADGKTFSFSMGLFAGDNSDATTVQLIFEDDSTGPPATIPLPAGGLLLMSALAAIGLARKRTSKTIL